MSETVVKDFEVEITVKIKEKTRESYSRETSLFSATRSNTLMADSTAGLDEIRKEVVYNVKGIEKTVVRFFEKRLKNNN